MSFAAPLVLLALLAVAALAIWYVLEQRRLERVAHAFVAPALIASPAPRRPGARRHVPPALLAAGLALLIVAAARPGYRATVPVKGATVMLANDVSSSMTSSDVRPSRLAAARSAALTFLAAIPQTVQTGSIRFARHVTVLQFPTTDRALTEAAVRGLAPGGGGTAIGDAILVALAEIADAPKIGGTRPPGAIVMLSDGASNVGVPPAVAAQEAKIRHVRVYTVAIGTPGGTMLETRNGRTVTTPVPVDPTDLETVATLSGGHSYRAIDAASARAIYRELARTLGHTHVRRSLAAPLAGAGLVLLLAGAGASLLWFARIA